MERSRIAIIIPALNEAASISEVVARISEYGLPIVVDDGSSDGTAVLAHAAGADVVTHATNQGYDRALNSGFARAAQLDCAYFITLDADGQHAPEQLKEMVGYLDGGYELVLGVRDRFQRAGESLFARCASLLWSISDPLCGMKGYTVTLYRKAGHFDTVRSIGTELAVRSKLAGARTIEIPILTCDRVGAPRFGGRFMANYKILRALVVMVAMYGGRKRTN